MDQALIVKEAQNLNQEIRSLRSQGVIVIGNETVFENGQVPLGFRVVKERVFISTEKTGGDVYPQKGGGLSLSAVALKRIGKALNIRWQGGTILSYERTGISYRAFAVALGLDGQYCPYAMDYECNLEAIADEYFDAQMEKAQIFNSGKVPPNEIPNDFKYWSPKGDLKGWATEKTRKEMVQKRKRALTLAQTGAQMRIVRHVGSLKATYTKAELDKGIVVIKLVQHLDPNNPVHQEFALKQAQPPMMMFPGQSEQISFSSHSGSQLESSSPPVEIPHFQEPLEAAEMAIDDHREEERFSAEETALLDFDNCDAQDQVGAIQSLIKKKQWGGSLKKALTDFSPEERRKMFQMLLTYIPKKSDQMPWDS